MSVLPDGGETLRLLTVRVLVKPFAVMLSIVTVPDAALVMRTAGCTIDGGAASDQSWATCQEPPVELMQLLVCACEAAVMIALIAIANVSQMARPLNGFILESGSSTKSTEDDG